LNGVTVDKHSTGGVGDKTTLIVAPIVAALGCKIAKMSGRGLGFTGGTADKLESIEGYRVNVCEEEFIKQVNKIGISLITQTKNITPADKKIYALRDVTATVDSIPLITSSIMSKKIAAGSKCILLDVKVGNGAFMKTLDSAKELAKKMINIGNLVGRKTRAVITNMDTPLGNKIGNTLEVQEVIDVLNNKGPEDTRNVSIELATNMVMMCTNKSKEECKEEVVDVVKNGSALNKFKELVQAQGGNVDLIDNPNMFPKAKNKIPVIADRVGYIYKMDTEAIGKVSSLLGAGRQKKDDIIDYSAGIVINAKTGDFVNRGDVLAVLHTSKENIKEEVEMYLKALEISRDEPKKEPLIYDTL